MLSVEAAHLRCGKWRLLPCVAVMRIISQIYVKFSSLLSDYCFFQLLLLGLFCHNNCVLDQGQTEAAVLAAVLVRQRKK